jgi:hypothetical protein
VAEELAVEEEEEEEADATSAAKKGGKKAAAKGKGKVDGVGTGAISAAAEHRSFDVRCGRAGAAAGS